MVMFVPVEIPDAGVPRLQHFVAERLATLRISRDELARRGGPHRSTLNKSFNSPRGVSRATLARLDASLGWAPGSAARILQGGVPVSRLHFGPDQAHVMTVLRATNDLLNDCVELLSDTRELVQGLLTPADGNHRGDR